MSRLQYIAVQSFLTGKGGLIALLLGYLANKLWNGMGMFTFLIFWFGWIASQIGAILDDSGDRLVGEMAVQKQAERYRDRPRPSLPAATLAMFAYGLTVIVYASGLLGLLWPTCRIYVLIPLGLIWGICGILYYQRAGELNAIPL
jgi:hypothetical protein